MRNRYIHNPKAPPPELLINCKEKTLAIREEKCGQHSLYVTNSQMDCQFPHVGSGPQPCSHGGPATNKHPQVGGSVHWDARIKHLRLGIYKPQKYISHSPGGQEVPNQDSSRLCVW